MLINCPHCSENLSSFRWYTLRKEGDFYRIDLVGFGLDTHESISTLIQFEADAQRIADELNRLLRKASA